MVCKETLMVYIRKVSYGPQKEFQNVKVEKFTGKCDIKVT